MSQQNVQELQALLDTLLRKISGDERIAMDLRSADPAAVYPYDTWAALIETSDTPGAVRGLAVQAWLEHYNDMVRGLYEQHMAGTTPQTFAANAVRLLGAVANDYGRDNHGERFRGSLPHTLILGAVLRALSMVVDGMLSSATDGPASDCGDPTCPGHAPERAAQAQAPMPSTHVVPRSDVRQVAALDGPLTGLYL